jgi:hypothetical protein
MPPIEGDKRDRGQGDNQAPPASGLSSAHDNRGIAARVPFDDLKGLSHPASEGPKAEQPFVSKYDRGSREQSMDKALSQIPSETIKAAQDLVRAAESKDKKGFERAFAEFQSLTDGRLDSFRTIQEHLSEDVVLRLAVVGSMYDFETTNGSAFNVIAHIRNYAVKGLLYFAGNLYNQGKLDFKPDAFSQAIETYGQSNAKAATLVIAASVGHARDQLDSFDSKFGSGR